MDADTHSKARVAKKQNEAYVSVKINLDRSGSDLFEKFGGRGIPATFVVDADGDVLESMSGFVKPDKYLKLISEVSRKYTKLVDLRKATEKDSSSVAAHWKVADAARELGSLTAALRAYRRAASLLEKEDPRTDATARKLAEAAYRVAQVLTQRGPDAIKEARKAADKFDAMDPENKSGFADNLAIERAMLAYYESDAEKALELLEAAARKYPKTDEPGRLWFMIGVFRHNTGNHDGASPAFKKAAKLEPKSEWGKRAAEAVENLKQQDH